MRHRGLDGLVEADAQQVDVDELAAHRVVLLVLDDHRLGGAAVDHEVEHGAGLGQRQAQLAAVDREGGGSSPPP